MGDNKKQIKQWATAPEDGVVDEFYDYAADIITNKGTISVELFKSKLYRAVNNFVFLSQEKFYDGVVFYRILKSMMICTGDPMGDGTGGPGYSILYESDMKTKFGPGMLCYDSTGPNLHGSRFFICTEKESLHLNSQPIYSIFGKVTQGMDVVEKIAATPVKRNPRTMELSLPVENVFIETVKINKTKIKKK